MRRRSARAGRGRSLPPNEKHVGRLRLRYAHRHRCDRPHGGPRPTKLDPTRSSASLPSSSPTSGPTRIDRTVRWALGCQNPWPRAAGLLRRPPADPLSRLAGPSGVTAFGGSRQSRLESCFGHDADVVGLSVAVLCSGSELPLAVVVDKPTAARAAKLDVPEAVGVALDRGCRFTKAAVHVRPALSRGLQESAAQMRELRPGDRGPRPLHHRSRAWRNV